jgi:hypothetical protein
MFRLQILGQESSHDACASDRVDVGHTKHIRQGGTEEEAGKSGKGRKNVSVKEGEGRGGEEEEEMGEKY